MALKEGFYKFGHWDDSNETVSEQGLVLAEGGKLTILEDPEGYLKHLFKGGTIPLDHAEQIIKSVNRNHYALFSYSDDTELYDKYEDYLHPKHPFFKSDTLGAEPKPNIRGIAENYMASKGLTLSHPPKVRVNEQRAKNIASAYHEMKHDPEHPQVKRAYHALKQETLDQFRHLQQNGLKISRIKPDQENPYKTSKDLMQDIHQNHHLWFFPTEQGFGSAAGPNNHPLLEPTGMEHEGKPLLYNDVFRIVHDYFGHVKEGHGFGPQGEENAWHNHMEMYSPEAQKALTTETRGQNSWVNFGPHGEHNRKNPGQTIYADQKAGLLPDWAMEHRPEDVAKSDTDELDDSVEKSKNVREQKAKIFGTDPNAPRVSEKRLKMMRILRDYAKKQYGLSMVTAEGKRDESGQLKEEADYTQTPYDVFSEKGLEQEAALNERIKQEIHTKMQTPEGRRLTDVKAHLDQIKEKHGEKPTSPEAVAQKRSLLAEKKLLTQKLQLPKRTDPKPDWRSGNLETQPSPDAAVHEIAHLNLAPEGMTPAEFQTDMDVRWGESQKKYGHMQQKKTQGEIQPMSIENPIRRELGLPANRTTKPVKEQEYALDDPSQPRFVEGKTSEGETAFYDRQSRLQSPETKERMQQIREGSLKFNPEKGWEKAHDTNAIVNLRGRGQKEEADTRSRARFSSRLGKSEYISEEVYESLVWDRVYEIEGFLEKTDGTEEDLSQHHGKEVFVYFNLHKKVWSIKDRKTGLVIAHSKKVAVDNPRFKVSEAGRQRVLKEKAKNVHAGVVGTLNAHHTDFNPEGKKRVSYNPYKYEHFYESDTQAAVHSADHATLHVEEKQGPEGKPARIPHVYAKNPTSNSSPVQKSEDVEKSPVRSPRKGHTIAQLQNLKDMGWHNPDTGTEISEEEGEEHLWRLREKKAERQVKDAIKPKKTPKSENPGDWFDKEEKIPGGLSSGKKAEDFDQEQLSAGIKVEMEHTTDKDIATEIAMDHLSEDPDYYKKLKTIEKSEEIEKGLKEMVVGAAMASALASPHLAADQHSVTSAPKASMAAKKPRVELKGDLKHIAMIESSGGKNKKHAKTTVGLNAGDTAAGSTGLMPIMAKEAISKDPQLAAKHGHILKMKNSEITAHLNKNPDTEAEIANSHWSRLDKTFKGDRAKMAFAWRNGITAAKQASKEEIESHPYVKKFNSLTSRSVASESEKVAKAKKIAEIAKSLVLEKIGQITHSLQPQSVGHDVFQKDLEAAMGSFAVDTGGIRSFNEKKKEDDRSNSLSQVPSNHKKKFERAMKEADLEGQIIGKLTSLKKKLKR